MVLVIQIALGIVLAFVIIAYFRQLVSIGAILLLTGLFSAVGWVAYENIDHWRNEVIGLFIILFVGIIFYIFIIIIDRIISKLNKKYGINREVVLESLFAISSTGFAIYFIINEFVRTGEFGDSTTISLAFFVPVGGLGFYFARKDLLSNRAKLALKETYSDEEDNV
ncbi:MAG: hypothetical protein JKY04_03310 [Sneathiella sp.]|nr:hypothetical protein [Sneathiella sp.]MBL4898726.1 hypothetical protein [Colwellia sp.]